MAAWMVSVVAALAAGAVLGKDLLNTVELERDAKSAPPSNALAVVLLVSDDAQLRALLAELLLAHRYAVVAVESTRMLATREPSTNYDVAIVDAPTLQHDAGRVLRTISRFARQTIAIAAEGFQSDSLILQGDVVLSRPFDPRELLLILRGMFPTNDTLAAESEELLSVGPINLHTLLNTVTVAARDVTLTGVETRVLRELMLSASTPVPRDRLMRRALGRDWSPFDRCLDTHIKRLRRKIGNDRDGRTPIRTIRGVGYLLLAKWKPGP
jgi:two-component system response regulator CpxR